jgi:hypothetical protein
MPDALCQAMRSKTATPDNVAWQTSHAAVSSNAEVNCDPALAQGTAATTTPCSAHTTREHSSPRSPDSSSTDSITVCSAPSTRRHTLVVRTPSPS